MNIVFDDGLNLDDNYREALAPILPVGNAPLKLDSATSKTDGTPCPDEGFVFLTHLPVDVLKYHSVFFRQYSNAPQWFFVLLNRNDHGLTDLRNAARRCGLKNCTMFHARNLEAFEVAIKEISTARHITKGKALLLSKHKRSWTGELAELLFGGSEGRYEIMDAANLSATDSDILLLCGEKISDFTRIALPEHMEPYFIFRFKDDLQNYLDPGLLVEEIAAYYHMTAERVASRLFFVDIESEKWLSNPGKTTGADAVSDGILLWDRFGLPVSRSAYTEDNIAQAARRSHESLEALKKNILMLA